MDEAKLRKLERQYKLRVKTGCGTCRKRRVKCDETKPECLRCTKSNPSRKCEGYKHAEKNCDQSPATAASFRNPSFLVVPQRRHPAKVLKRSSSLASPDFRSPSVSRSISRSFSPESAECRSFSYFQSRTLPQWTEFFDSDLWSQEILQLSYVEPAIKHGILALSTLHERFENNTPVSTGGTDDYPFLQYMQAVKHSNDLLTAHQQGKVDVERVLIACIIFTCYENLAGNFVAGQMHLRNGLRILGQHRRDMLLQARYTPTRESIENVLYRFDLQAMTFSDNASPYDYRIDNPPQCPEIPAVYHLIADARDDLVGLLRCMMWVSGVADHDPHAQEDPTWLHIYTRLLSSFGDWERVFFAYEQTLYSEGSADPKKQAGNILLKMYANMARVIVGACKAEKGEMTWDSFLGTFQNIVDIGETLPSLARLPASLHSRSCSHSSSSPPHISRSASPQHNSPGPVSIKISASAGASPNTPSMGYASPKQKPTAFTPSFELSPIVPLFVTACRCRDPETRRRAIALLLDCRRREGMWDSYGAAMVALQVVRLEEEIADVDFVGYLGRGHGNWLPYTPGYIEAADVVEAKRMHEVHVKVDMGEKVIAVSCAMRDGERVESRLAF